MSRNINLLILAAGASVRLGEPKQLLSFGSSTLLGHVIRKAIESKLGRVTVVLGANRDDIFPSIEKLNCNVHHFERWVEGMGSSLAFGLEVSEQPDDEAVIVLMGDQPFLTAAVLQDIYQTYKNENAGIVRSAYRQGFGPPVLFDKTLFPELKKLNGEQGAQSIVLNHLDVTRQVSFPKGDIDIDAPDDLVYLKDK